MLTCVISINAIQVLEAAELNSFVGECLPLTVNASVFALTVNRSQPVRNRIFWD